MIYPPVISQIGLAAKDFVIGGNGVFLMGIVGFHWCAETAMACVGRMNRAFMRGSGEGWALRIIRVVRVVSGYMIFSGTPDGERSRRRFP